MSSFLGGGIVRRSDGVDLSVWIDPWCASPSFFSDELQRNA